MTAKIVVNVILIKSGTTKGKTTNFTAKSKDLWAMSINPKAPPIKEDDFPQGVSQENTNRLSLLASEARGNQSTKGKEEKESSSGTVEGSLMPP